jgi:hypothetical protein
MTAREVRFRPGLRNKVNLRPPVQGRCSSKFLKLRRSADLGTQNSASRSLWQRAMSRARRDHYTGPARARVTKITVKGDEGHGTLPPLL